MPVMPRSRAASITAAPAATATNPEEEKKTWRVAELRQELEHFLRKCHSLEQRVATQQQHLVTARQQEDVMLKEMEVSRDRALTHSLK